MMKLRYLLYGMIIGLVLINTASAGIFTIDDALAAISIRPISSFGSVGNVVAEKDLRTETLQTLQLDLTKSTKTETKYVQMYPSSLFVISSDFAGSTSIMQTSTKDGYPLLEVYYGYQKSQFEPFRYYLRVVQVDGTNAYVVYGDFSTRSARIGTIPKSTYDAIIAGVKIPDWNTIQGG
jgi:hypothetical protein